MDYGAYRIDETNVVPQLARFNAIKVAFERFILEPAPGLLSSFKENFAIRLEQAVFEEPVPDGPNLRIIVEVSLDGKWRQKGSEDPVAIFSGRYRALFEFKEKTEPSHVNKCMSEKWYRDFLVAQVYPLAKIHMADELRMVGINTSRVKGYDVYGGKFESVDPQGKNKSAPVKKPKINVTRNKKSN